MKGIDELIERLNDALAREMRAQAMYGHYATYVKGIHRLHLKPYFENPPRAARRRHHSPF